MMNSLDFHYYVITYVTRQQFHYEGFTITIDDYYHMDECMAEIETLVNDQSEVTDAENRIDEFLSKNQLKSLDSEGTVNFISKMNLIKETQIDFTKISVEDWFKRWEEFINCNI